jgi:hypothetical protein
MDFCYKHVAPNGAPRFSAGFSTELITFRHMMWLRCEMIWRTARKGRGGALNFRGKDIRHMKPNWYESSIWQKSPSGKGFVDIRVMVAKKDLPAFKSMTEPGGSDMVLHGGTERDVEANFLFVRLLGRTANADSSGNATTT